MITEPQNLPIWGSGATHPLDHISETNSTREILFADPTVAGYETLIPSTSPSLQIVVLDPNRDAISQIGEILSHQEQPLDALHILSHAQPGILHLGGTLFTAENLPEVEISQWAKALTPNADILLYGCNLAADTGAMLHRLAALTGADIAASDNLTGNAALGGDWTLEVSTGPVEAQIPFSPEAIGSYTGVLAPTELFISEYVEGSSNNKALEFYNGTGNTIDLAAGNYSVQVYFNGSTTPNLTINLSGIVPHGSTFVVAHSMASLAVTSLANQTQGGGWFNGDDAIVLFKNTTIIDSIGQIGFDPGAAWTGGGLSTLDNTLRRKLSVTAGDTNPNDTFNPSIQWVGYPQDTFAGLGSHNQPPQITISDGNLNYTENDGFALLNTSATATDPDLTNFNGSTLTVNFTNGATTDDILMIRNQGTGAGQIGAGIDSPGLNLITYSGLPIATFTGGTKANPLTINFSTNFANDTAVAALMQNILYGNISDNPSSGTRTVQFQLTDALGGSSIPASKTIDLTAANDAPIIGVPGASFTLYNGTNTPNSQDFEYRTLPYLPIAATQNGVNLNSSGNPSDYAGYIARADRIPQLDRNSGYTINFTAQILAENHSLPGADKNGDSIADRAGFSVTAISSDGQKGIEIGFWEDTIWVQEEGAAEPPTDILFTHTTTGESVNFDTKTNPVNYQLEVLGNTYQLLADGNPVISGNLRDYTSFISPGFLPANPYTTPNFLFFGDNTPSASANFNLSAVSVTTGATLPPVSGDEDMPLVVNGITVNDADAALNNITVTLTVNNGNLTVNSGVAGGVAAANITANGTNSVTLTGTVTEINQTLADAAGLTYQGLSDFYGTDNLTIVANDGAITDTQVINITVNSVNDAPVLTLPPSQIANQSVNLPISGINVADVDAASGSLEVSLSANNGYLTLSNLTNLTLINGDGIGDAAMTFSGTLADIHNAFNNLVYQSDANYSGADTINIVVNDLGNTGAGGSLSAAGNIAVTVNPKGVLTLGEHAASQISDQFITGSTSVPDMTVWHRFRLSVVNEPVITNSLTFAVTAAGIGDTNISNLQLVADVNHNGIYDTGDVPVGTVEAPLAIADGITLSNFTVPVGDNDYLLVGGVNNLQDGSTLSLALNNGDIVAANANSISISADGTVSTTQHIADGIVPDTSNPPPDTSNPPPDTSNPPPDTSNPPPDTSNPPPDTSNPPPPDTSNPPPDTSNPPPDTSNPPVDTNNPPPDTSNPPPDTSNPPVDTNNPPVDTNNPPVDTNNPPVDTNNPPVDTNNPPVDTNNPPVDTNNPPVDTNNPPVDTNNPPVDTNNPPVDTNNPPVDTNNPPPGDNSGNPPPGDNSGNPPPGDNSGNLPPGDNSGNLPPGDNSGNLPPGDNSGNLPPVVPVVRSGDGSRLVLPPETEPGGELNYCVTIHIPESLNFSTMPDSDWVGNILNGGETQDVLMGGNGEDALGGGGGDDRIYGGEGSDRIDGGDGNDTMQGGMGRHIPSYQGDRDAIKGGLGNDRIYGNEDNDRLSGDEGDDTIYSGLGEDIAWGGPDRDLIYGDRGSDTLSGDADNDSIYGGPSDPDLANEDGADYISGGTGDDFLNGNQGADKIGGGEGDDTLHGGKGNDWLAGDSGEDMLFGDNGDDILCGGDGDDTLIGGSGSDRFILWDGRGTQTIADFETGIDKLILASNSTLAELSLQQQSGLTTISSNGKVIAIVFGVSRITAQDFQPNGS